MADGTGLSGVAGAFATKLANTAATGIGTASNIKKTMADAAIKVQANEMEINNNALKASDKASEGFQF